MTKKFLSSLIVLLVLNAAVLAQPPRPLDQHRLVVEQEGPMIKPRRLSLSITTGERTCTVPR
jgi:hypothetical protein